MEESRDLTRAGLEEDPGLEVVGEAADGGEAIAAIDATRPDVVVLDLSMPGVGGLEAIPSIRAGRPGVGIVVFSGLDAAMMTRPALSRGADGYVEKGEPFEAVRRAIHRAADRSIGPEPVREAAEVDFEQLASAASHDLAEPLRVISGFANLLARRYGGRLDPEADRYIAAILSGADRMQALIDALLAYTRVGQAELVRELVNCCELVRDAAAGVSEDAAITIGDLPVVAAEPSLLGELFQNLLSNAVRFRSEKPPEVHVDAERLDGEWCLSVADNGVGIDPSQAVRVFEMFQRLAGRDKPGTGIGLATCKRIVERHGGRIWVEPRPGGGSVFRFTIADPANPPGPPR